MKLRFTSKPFLFSGTLVRLKISPCMRVFPPLFLFGAVVIPPLVFVTLGTSSMAAGVLLVAALFAVLFVILGAEFWHTKRLFSCTITTLFAMLVVLGISTISLLLNRGFDASRFISSFMLFVLVTFGAFALARLSMEVSEKTADKAVRFVFYLLLITGIAGGFGYAPLLRERFPISVSFFAERSHYALSFLPFLLYMTVTARRKLFPIAIGFGLAFALVNLTLVVGTGLIALLALRMRYAVFAVLIAAGLWAFTPDVDLTYYAERIDLSPDSENLSVLAFLQGWERAYLDFIYTYGVGVGFQQFGIVGVEGDIQKTIFDLIGKDLNAMGSTVGAKLIGEFGVVGVLLLLAYLWNLAKYLRWVGHDRRDIFFRCCFVMYAVDLFIRGTGYFSPTGFLFLASLYWMALTRPIPARTR